MQGRLSSRLIDEPRSSLVRFVAGPFCRWDVGRSIDTKGGECDNKKELQRLRSGIGGLPDGRCGVR